MPWHLAIERPSPTGCERPRSHRTGRNTVGPENPGSFANGWMLSKAVSRFIVDGAKVDLARTTRVIRLLAATALVIDREDRETPPHRRTRYLAIGDPMNVLRHQQITRAEV